nr:ATP synthase F0 subunit 6 [Raillietina sp. HL-2022]
MFSGYNSLLSIIYNNFVSSFPYCYLCAMLSTLGLFILYRVPYCYSPFLFSVFLVSVVFSAFVVLFLSRVMLSINSFFSTFVPVGTPMYICPLVCLAESISYIIRPLVLILRPFINISLGCMGAVALGNLCFVNTIWFMILFILFFYEVFVAIVHWYIVISILDFSVDH